jgi:dipeptidyl aminopeptidase/acylaminoacyl peptidase
MKKWLIYLFVALVSIAFGWELRRYYTSSKTPLNPIAQIKPRPLDKYTFDSLSKAKIQNSNIKIEETLKEDKNSTSYLFSFSLDPTLRYNSQQSVKKVTGVMNVPKGEGPFPAVVMFRGYVDQKAYTSGEGTKRAAEVFAQNGYITIALDFLGYAGSDLEADNIFESRFQTYTTALTLLNSLNSISEWDKRNVFLWGHSNGGQIALTVLEITGGNYPTTLWAPVSKPFPYSILYYTDESDDRGKLIRSELAKFEQDYDVEAYSLVNFLNKIAAPLQLHQGTADDAVPVAWTNSLVKEFKNLSLDVNYYLYSGADHNLTPGWNTVVARDLTFFQKNLKD